MSIFEQYGTFEGFRGGYYGSWEFIIISTIVAGKKPDS